MGMGSYGTGGMGAKGFFNAIATGNGSINVPGNIWKVAVIIPTGNNDMNRVSSSTRIIAINTPNSNNISRDWKQYVVSIDDIEAATGYDLLSNLPKNTGCYRK